MNINEILQDPGMRSALITRLAKEEGFFKMRGDVDIVLRNEASGEILGKRLVRNLVINTGLYHIADRLEDSPDEVAMGWAAIGSDNTAATATDTALLSELGRVALTSKIQGAGGSANQVTYSATIPAGTGTGTVVEAGILNAVSSGILLARTVFSPIVKGSGDAIDLAWILSVSAA